MRVMQFPASTGYRQFHATGCQTSIRYQINLQPGLEMNADKSTFPGHAVLENVPDEGTELLIRSESRIG
jgi:hypothetical protein